ncbi:uncharacterized protein LOC126614541 [Malus sylvestris]|uniref:uncharacterized protein LOC126614541 n=1 Tax=Malus sylvestris TaxID=3752 RepID=UPI0021ACD319|nr:uncharacterized protein LOC126614541 [Malus sylvestris]
MRWKAWKAMPEKVNYNLDDINEDMLACLNRLYSERYKQWKSDLHQYFEMFSNPQVALEEGVPNELEDRQDNWDAKANKGNREKKTLFHHSGSRPFSYRMEEWRKEGSKFPEIDLRITKHLEILVQVTLPQLVAFGV